MELKPLNCSGSSHEEIGQWLSNPTLSPFIIDGVRFASVEAFYIVIRTADASRHEAIAELHGRKAKNTGKNLQKKLRATRGSWQGCEFELGSDDHHRLLKRAIREKLLQNPEMLTAFLATAPRPIVHDTGFPESRFTQLPAEKFARILMDLRDELNVS